MKFSNNDQHLQHMYTLIIPEGKDEEYTSTVIENQNLVGQQSTQCSREL
jgi:hypothetical protein